MSTAEPFMPADEPIVPEARDRELDLNHDIDLDREDDDGAVLPDHLADNSTFRRPVPGATLSEGALEKDLEGE